MMLGTPSMNSVFVCNNKEIEMSATSTPTPAKAGSGKWHFWIALALAILVGWLGYGTGAPIEVWAWPALAAFVISFLLMKIPSGFWNFVRHHPILAALLIIGIPYLGIVMLRTYQETGELSFNLLDTLSVVLSQNMATVAIVLGAVFLATQLSRLSTRPPKKKKDDHHD
jgi:hypothetical protein